ncbi:TVP38/TMEM64 family protein [Streptomyces sp. 549]|nr:TVP38/TMEM64 family protein [Streptomyces sp. 549]MDK1474519.1 TVP38/TMEM64 family protein [Streptomyces sp. 549]
MQSLCSARARLVLLVVLLASAAALVIVHQPQRMLTDPAGQHLGASTAVLTFGVAYALCTAAFVPRPVLNIAAGVLFGAQWGTVGALAGTVAGAGISFGLGRLLGQDGLRPLLRGRWLQAGDRQLSLRGFRAMLVLRLVPGVPFAASNYGAAVSRMSWGTFLGATAVGSVPNTAAYVVAGSRATEPASPVFLAAFAFITVTGAAAALVGWRRRAQLRAAAGA